MATGSTAEELYWPEQEMQSAIILIALSVFFVGLKLLASGLQARNAKGSAFVTNVALIVAALVAFLALCTLAIIHAQAYKAFYLSHSRSEALDQYIIISKVDYAISVVYPVACVLPKLSMCFLYLRLFGLDVWTSRISKALIVFLILNAISWLIPSIVVCHPISQFWNVNGHQPGHCLDYNIFGTWISLPHVVSDLVMLALPIPIIYRTQMKIAKKLGLAFTFVVASCGIVTATLRLASYIRRTYVTRPGTNETTKSIVLDTVYSILEPGLYLVAACLPSLRIVMVRLHSSLNASLHSWFQKGHSTDPREQKEGHELPLQVDVKLTGGGYLQSLAHEGELIGHAADEISV